MQHKTLFRILTAITGIALALFTIGPLLTAPAPTAVNTLSADFPVESVKIPARQGADVHGWLVRGSIRDSERRT